MIDLRSTDTEVDFLALHQKFIEPILLAPTEAYVAVHHHHRGPGLFHMEEYFRDVKARLQASGCDLVRFTMLRDPVARLKSALYFNLANEPPQLFRSSVNHELTTEQKQYMWTQLANNPIYDNLMTRYILNNKLEDFEHAPFPMALGGVNSTASTLAIKLLSSFEYVGFQEDIQGGNVTRQLGELLGIVNPPPLRKHQVNRHPDDAFLQIPSVLDVLKARTEHDQIVYDAFRG